MSELTAIRTSLFFFNHTATTEIYTLSLHDALPICHKTPEAPQALRNFRSPRWQRIPQLEPPKTQEPPIADNEKNSPGGSPHPHSPGQYPELPLQFQHPGPVSYKLRTRPRRD